MCERPPQDQETRGSAGSTTGDWSFLDPEVSSWLEAARDSSELYRHLENLQVVISVAAAGLAAKAQPNCWLNAIEEALGRIAQSNEIEASDACAAFHVAVLEATANGFFTPLEFCRNRCRLSFRWPEWSGRAPVNVANYRAVCVAILARNPSQAEQQMLALVGSKGVGQR